MRGESHNGEETENKTREEKKGRRRDR